MFFYKWTMLVFGSIFFCFSPSITIEMNYPNECSKLLIYNLLKFHKHTGHKMYWVRNNISCEGWLSEHLPTDKYRIKHVLFFHPLTICCVYLILCAFFTIFFCCLSVTVVLSACHWNAHLNSESRRKLRIICNACHQIPWKKTNTDNVILGCI